MALIAVLLGSRSADAQQVCYSYDGLGRLTGVINEANEAAFYDYDAVGNILSIRRQSPSGPVTVFSFDPPAGSPGSKVEVFGLGFSATANQNSATIGGVPATVVSTLPCTIIVEVPPNVASGPISVTSPNGTGTSSQNFTLFSLTIPPVNPALLKGASQQFGVSFTGCPDPRVTWKVNGIVGGNSTFGTISSTGLYTVPAVVPSPATVTIRVESVGCIGLFAERTVTIVNELLGFVYAHASANYGAIPIVYAPNTVLHSASATHGNIPIQYVPDTILSSASVNYGTPGVEFVPNVVFHSASFANVPVITAVNPSSAARGSNFIITVTGLNLTGATDMRFMTSALADTAITATNVVVNPSGTSLTARRGNADDG